MKSPIARDLLAIAKSAGVQSGQSMLREGRSHVALGDDTNIGRVSIGNGSTAVLAFSPQEPGLAVDLVLFVHPTDREASLDTLATALDALETAQDGEATAGDALTFSSTVAQAEAEALRDVVSDIAAQSADIAAAAADVAEAAADLGGDVWESPYSGVTVAEFKVGGDSLISAGVAAEAFAYDNPDRPALAFAFDTATSIKVNLANASGGTRIVTYGIIVS